MDYIVCEGNITIWKNVSSKKFFHFLLNILKTKGTNEVQNKILLIIENWGIKFENKRETLPNFYKVYQTLKNGGLKFPPQQKSNYLIYLNESKSQNNNFKEENNQNLEENDEAYYYIDVLQEKLKTENFENKYKKFISYLLLMNQYIKKINIMLNNKNRNKDLINELKKGNNTLIGAVGSGKLKDETLIEITMATNDDINQTLAREEDIKNGISPKPFTSYFILNNILQLTNVPKKSRVKSGDNNDININNDNNDEKNNLDNAKILYDIFSNNKQNNSDVKNQINSNNNNNTNLLNDFSPIKNKYNMNDFDFNRYDCNNYTTVNNEENHNFNMNNEINIHPNNIMNNNAKGNIFYNNSNNNIGYNMNNNLYNDVKNNKINDNYINKDIFNTQFNNSNNQMSKINFFNKNDASNNYNVFGPSPEFNSKQMVPYISSIAQPTNNVTKNMNNNFKYENSNNKINNFMKSNNIQMTKEEIEREKNIKELDDLFNT